MNPDASWKRMIDPLMRRVLLSVGRVILKIVDDTTKVQRAQIGALEGEVRDSVEVFEHYGFTSVPFPEAEGIAVFVGGNRSHGVVVAHEDRRYRKKGLQPGEVAVYCYNGDYIKFCVGNKIEIHTPHAEFSGDVTIKGNTAMEGTLDVTKDIRSDADISDQYGSMGEIREVYNDHDHDETQTVTQEPNQKMT